MANFSDAYMQTLFMSSNFIYIFQFNNKVQQNYWLQEKVGKTYLTF